MQVKNIFRCKKWGNARHGNPEVERRSPREQTRKDVPEEKNPKQEEKGEERKGASHTSRHVGDTFEHQPEVYRDEETKCAFLLSLLMGRALDWASTVWDVDPQIRSLFDYFTESHETLAPGHILRYYEDFKEVFSKEKAGHIPEHRAWDCAIDLLPNTTPLKAKFTLSHCQRQKPCLPHRSIHSISEHYQAMRLVEKLMAAEVNYDVGNQELLSIKATLEEWQHWLEGARHPFLVLTDHHNL
ncbi:hypothetical protein QTP70_004126 [Hemibagrus guttatus]|uniref:Reverse transcriptase RNase H-like domain-containing protein n=1 Tax=Hemibagrus guttatus TaxID=175788 RepID=A0AAE0UX92_9TELE|nr:hypothetical protein QTP70_004126 [Hemibagrus guttatus]